MNPSVFSLVKNKNNRLVLPPSGENVNFFFQTIAYYSFVDGGRSYAVQYRPSRDFSLLIYSGFSIVASGQVGISFSRTVFIYDFPHDVCTTHRRRCINHRQARYGRSSRTETRGNRSTSPCEIYGLYRAADNGLLNELKLQDKCFFFPPASPAAAKLKRINDLHSDSAEPYSISLRLQNVPAKSGGERRRQVRCYDSCGALGPVSKLRCLSNNTD